MEYTADVINEIIEKGTFDDLVKISEDKHEAQYNQLMEMIIDASKVSRAREINNTTDAIIISGPSSSGKTTFANELAKRLAAYDFTCHVISVDDYYLDRDVILERQKNMPCYDFETIEAFDVAYFKKQMNEYLNGKVIMLPRYDFPLGLRCDSNKFIVPSSKDIVIVEGLHGLNPYFTEGIDFTHKFRVYISPRDTYSYESQIIHPWDIRFMRRACRDATHRNAGLSRTMEMWPTVQSGEEKYIKPFKEDVDFTFNSSLEYEICYLKKRLIKMAKGLTPTQYQLLGKMIPLEAILHFRSFVDFAIPKNSIFNEFSD